MKLVIFGGSGGLGSQMTEMFKDKYEVRSLSSKDVDITNLTEVVNFFKNNPTDIVLNLSGYNYDALLHRITPENENEIDKVIDINAKGNINILAGCLPYMRQNNFGRVIIISSVLSGKSVVGTSTYSSTKSFIDTLVRVASAENISKGVTCNSIRLGYFDAGMCHRIPEKASAYIKNTIGLKRWGSMQELYNTINYMIDTEYFTGQNLEISGGLQ
jgi:NAD(P)-dependent dehydrogenase (short-subunit alcohol dehydrogenase family)